MKQLLWLGLVLFTIAICTNCGDTFRPVIIPNSPAFPDPRAAHTALTISDNGGNRGTIMVADVSGDTEIGVADLGLAPVHAVQQTGNQVLVVNHSITGAVADSLTKVNFSGINISSTTTISLPPDSAPNFVATTQSDTAYVSLPAFTPPSVGVVNTVSNAVLQTVPVGANPVALAETPDGKKVYVANRGDNTVTRINTLDRTTSTISGAFSAPRWIIARSDSQRVYVLNGDGTLTTIDTTSNTDVVLQTGLPVGTAAYMVYDVRLNRIYVPSASQIVVLDVAPDLPHILGNNGNPIPIAPFPRENRNSSDVCFGAPDPNPPAVNAVAVAALPDGSRAYVGSFYTDVAGNICPQVTVINTSANTVKTTIAIPGVSGIAPNSPPVCSTTAFRLSMAAGGDSSRVYLSSCDGGNLNIVRTSDDTYLVSLLAPTSVRPPIPPNNQPPPQNPVYLIAGP